MLRVARETAAFSSFLHDFVSELSVGMYNEVVVAQGVVLQNRVEWLQAGLHLLDPKRCCHAVRKQAPLSGPMILLRARFVKCNLRAC